MTFFFFFNACICLYYVFVRTRSRLKRLWNNKLRIHSRMRWHFCCKISFIDFAIQNNVFLTAWIKLTIQLKTSRLAGQNRDKGYFIYLFTVRNRRSLVYYRNFNNLWSRRKIWNIYTCSARVLRIFRVSCKSFERFSSSQR